MSYDNEWLNETLAARKQSVRETIRRTTIEEARALGAARFPSATDPWAPPGDARLRPSGRARARA